ncbi:MAG: DUF3791 domain-containing protein [Chitinivibrionia bacterium]|nr:DUF3791 domain-containing protein [Chitinivibrionia bacterium]
MCKNESNEVMQFVIFAIEEYRAAKNITGKEALSLFQTSGLLDYIEEFYDVLHSQGTEYLIYDFDEYLSSKTYFMQK